MAPKYDDDPDGESRQLDAEAAHDRAVNAGRTPIYCGHGNQFLIAQELDRHEAKPYGPNPTPINHAGAPTIQTPSSIASTGCT